MTKCCNMEENCRFAEYLASAVDKAEQAISSILYPDYPEINKETIAKIQSAIDIMEDALDSDIFKP